MALSDESPRELTLRQRRRAGSSTHRSPPQAYSVLRVKTSRGVLHGALIMSLDRAILKGQNRDHVWNSAVNKLHFILNSDIISNTAFYVNLVALRLFSLALRPNNMRESRVLHI